MEIEMHKILSMDAPSQIPIEGEALGDHAFNILVQSSQAKECNWGWFVAPLSTLAKEGEQEDEDGASILCHLPESPYICPEINPYLPLM